MSFLLCGNPCGDYRKFCFQFQVLLSYTKQSKIFIEFLALIIRDRIYNYLCDEMRELDKHPNYMTVPAALKELDKIEMVRLTDNKYRLDHAVTATQKVILKSFGMDANVIRHHADRMSQILKEAK